MTITFTDSHEVKSMGIANAIYEGSIARAEALSLKQERRDRLRQLQSFEDLLEAVEAQNLRTSPDMPASVMAEIAELARTLPVPAPKAVLAAKSGARLHDALLSWQGALLDALRPHRLTYGDRYD
ncbi:MAG TPA: hypothetical protein VI296_01150 [Candidatus Dormibacteraeota bacterium]